ncbi:MULTISPECIES: GntR family transcriptional regulator [Vibrio]|jgi:DNA-binding GntR family transcriptional regulator|uniref:Transcriptional regulator n=1 Tax=Vibrio splendidus TaxID=29497 RepID=A0A2T5EFL8_VIBSP|nr:MULTISPECIES: GntR family transcriptional regulator [Vibrio]MBO7910008.1 GntR family transcriptional regulator [Vibrio sp. G41H]MCC4879657.1 GntR family transcriptional regulator [Vibrio splendidus]MCF7488838.1 GntR family transcriptional regulator [Vibrio sp. G-C-1]MCT4346957.1 GntR family transcriptional regulator [Vibrio sp. NC2]OEE72533.1 transcriptional regulator [Vibrio splendidus FF-6]
MDITTITKLQQDLLFKVIARLKADNAKAGSSLNESSLAQQFEVSRSPIRAVLKHLSAQGITKVVPYKGSVLQTDAADIEISGQDNDQQPRQEKLYLRVLMDLFFSELGQSFSEKDLQQRYDANRGEMQSVLRLLENDGIFRRSPGYKWQLDGVLNTLERHTESYRCRLIFEPAGLLEPTWILDGSDLEGCQERHVQAITNPESVNASQLFSLSAEFHEQLAACSGNRFLLSTMQQHNRLRKATDLVSMHIQSSVIKSCQRRLEIIELVLEGNNHVASTKLAQLLENDIRVMKRTYNDVMNVSMEQRESLINSIMAKNS